MGVGGIHKVRRINKLFQTHKCLYYIYAFNSAYSFMTEFWLLGCTIFIIITIDIIITFFAFTAWKLACKALVHC